MTPDLELVAGLVVLFRLPLMNAIYGQRVSKLQPEHEPAWDGTPTPEEALSGDEVNEILDDEEAEV